MLFAEHLVLIRGGGDIGTGVAWRLHRAGFPVGVLELPQPLTVRRTVALSSAVNDGETSVEGMLGRGVSSPVEIKPMTEAGAIPVAVSPQLPHLGQSVVVDARLAKTGLDTSRDDAPFVVGLGPGFDAGSNCHAVVETARGHHLGRVIWSGPAAADTGTPGIVEGRGVERVLRAPADGAAEWHHEIGDVVTEGTVLGTVGGIEIAAPFDGVVRGLVAAGTDMASGSKVGDVDPRAEPSACHEISDKALAVGGGVVEAVLTWLDTRG